MHLMPEAEAGLAGIARLTQVFAKTGAVGSKFSKAGSAMAKVGQRIRESRAMAFSAAAARRVGASPVGKIAHRIFKSRTAQWAAIGVPTLYDVAEDAWDDSDEAINAFIEEELGGGGGGYASTEADDPPTTTATTTTTDDDKWPIIGPGGVWQDPSNPWPEEDIWEPQRDWLNTDDLDDKWYRRRRNAPPPPSSTRVPQASLPFWDKEGEDALFGNCTAFVVEIRDEFCVENVERCQEKGFAAKDEASAARDSLSCLSSLYFFNLIGVRANLLRSPSLDVITRVARGFFAGGGVRGQV
jgi:hypothetical protein